MDVLNKDGSVIEDNNPDHIIKSATPEEKARLDLINRLKAQHGEVWQITVGGFTCYLKEPERKDLSYATTVGGKDPMKFNEVILKNCWLAGDECIKTSNKLFLGVSKVLGTLIEIEEATIKKL